MCPPRSMWQVNINWLLLTGVGELLSSLTLLVESLVLIGSAGLGRNRLHALLLRLAVAIRSVRVRVLSVIAVSRPVDTVTKWLTTAAKNWKGPQELVHSEDLLPVALGADIVQ